MKRFWVSITLGLTAYVALPMPGHSAPLPSRIATAKSKIAHKKYKEAVLSTTISGYNTKIGSLQGEIRGLQQRQNRIQSTLNDKRAELIAVRDRLEKARDRLERLRADLKTAESALAARLVDLYKADEPDILTVILNSDGFGDLLERTDFLERISEQDRSIVSRVRVLKAQAKKQESQLANLEQRAQTVAEQILARRDAVSSSKGRLVSSRVELQVARNGRKTILSRVRKSRVRLEGDLSKMQGQVQGALAGGAATDFSGIKRGSGRFVWPVNGPITSPFCERRAWEACHPGIDIGVPSGTPIHAADSGRVRLAGPTGGYGNYTCIQHTATLSSCYAHQSSIGVRVGQGVRQGQVIGLVGCTGLCFGAHLHFEARINGSVVNPLNYL